MTALTRLAEAAEAWSDRLNPIVVKEVRQGLRTRTFVVSFLMLLASSVLVALVAGGIALDGGERDLGAGVFLAFLACFGLVGAFVLPVTAHRAFVREREAEAWPVLQLAGLKPRAVLRGKIASAMVQGALYASAIAPFLFFSYFLEGIGLLSILLALMAAFLWQVFVVTIAICGASFADTKFGRGGVSGLLGLFIPISTLMLAGSFAAMLGRSGSMVTASEVLQILVVSVWALGSVAALVFEVGASRLADLSDDHAKGPRLALLVHLLGSAALVLWLGAPSDLDEFALASTGWGTSLVYVFGIFAATVEDGLARAHRKNGGNRHLLLPGALRGFRVTVLATAIVVGASAAMALLGDASSSEWGALFSVPFLMLGHLSLVIVVGRGLIPAAIGAPTALRVTTIATMIVLLVTAPLTELYELLEHPWLSGPLGLSLALVADRVLEHRETEAEARLDQARGSTPG